MVMAGSVHPGEPKSTSRWSSRHIRYFSREDIEENSPSRKDGIDLKEENYYRKWYCAFLREVGMRVGMPQMTIATATVFCHRFFLRQSHARNDRATVATACMYLAGKAADTPIPIEDLIEVSYEIANTRDPHAYERIRQRNFYHHQQQLVLTAERILLATLGFHLDICHPYKPLLAGLAKLEMGGNDDLRQMAWNFANDGLYTSLCLQFEAHRIAAAAIFLAAKFMGVKQLPSLWWHELGASPQDLEEISNQMLEMYDEKRGFLPLPIPSNDGGSTSVAIASTSTQCQGFRNPNFDPSSCDSNNKGKEKVEDDLPYVVFDQVEDKH